MKLYFKHFAMFTMSTSLMVAKWKTYVKFQQCQQLSPGYMVKFVNSIEKLNVNLTSQASRPITSNGTHAGFNSA